MLTMAAFFSQAGLGIEMFFSQVGHCVILAMLGMMAFFSPDEHGFFRRLSMFFFFRGLSMSSSRGIIIISPHAA